MEQYELKEMLTHVADGSVSVEEAVRRLKHDRRNCPVI